CRQCLQTFRHGCTNARYLCNVWASRPQNHPYRVLQNQNRSTVGFALPTAKTSRRPDTPLSSQIPFLGYRGVHCLLQKNVPFLLKKHWLLSEWDFPFGWQGGFLPDAQTPRRFCLRLDSPPHASHPFPAPTPKYSSRPRSTPLQPTHR